MQKVQPCILGRGNAGSAIARALLVLSTTTEEFEIKKPIWVSRDEDLVELRKKIKKDFPLFIISNPHGLHSSSLMKAKAAGFDSLICEKPICISLGEINKLKNSNLEAAVMYVFRPTWAIEKMREIVQSGAIGKVFAVEGKYWRPSLSQKSKVTHWKNDVRLSGPHDTLLDIAPHWIDSVASIVGESCDSIEGKAFFVNSPARHRDTHLQLQMCFGKKIRGSASFSKIAHGSTNNFEIQILGSEGTLYWDWLKTDEIMMGRGKKREIIVRENSKMGSQQSPFYGLGWLEGHIEILRRYLNAKLLRQKKVDYPSLRADLSLMKVLLSAKLEKLS